MPKVIAQKGSDKIEVEILNDGSLKISTDKISMANHGGAEILISELIKSAGGTVERNRKGAHQHHHGDGNYEHAHG